MTVTPLHPDLGAPGKKIVDGEVCYNTAGVLEVAKQVSTPQSRAFLRAFNAAWRASEGSPMTDEARKRAAITSAAAAIGHSIAWRDAP